MSTTDSAEAIVELVTDQPSEGEVIAAFESELDRIVDFFWQQTNDLVAGNAIQQNRQALYQLASRQVHQSLHQQQALVAVQRHAESQINELTARQHETSLQLHQALEEMRAILQGELLQVARLQDVREGTSQEALRDEIAQLVSSAQREAVATHQAISDQASKVHRFEQHVVQVVQQVSSELNARMDAIVAGVSTPHAFDIQSMWSSMEEKLKLELDRLKSGLVDECVATTQRRLHLPNRNHTKLLIDRSVGEMEDRVQANLRLALKAALEDDRDREQAALVECERTDDFEARLRQEMRDGQAKLEMEIRAQTDVVSILETNFRTVCQAMSDRIDALEQGQAASDFNATKLDEFRVGHDGLSSRVMRLETRLKELEQQLQADIKSVLRKNRRNVIHRSKKLDNIISATQKSVRARAEMSARYYDLRCKLFPQADVSGEEEERKSEL